MSSLTWPPSINFVQTRKLQMSSTVWPILEFKCELLKEHASFSKLSKWFLERQTCIEGWTSHADMLDGHSLRSQTVHTHICIHTLAHTQKCLYLRQASTDAPSMVAVCTQNYRSMGVHLETVISYDNRTNLTIRLFYRHWPSNINIHRHVKIPRNSFPLHCAMSLWIRLTHKCERFQPIFFSCPPRGWEHEMLYSCQLQACGSLGDFSVTKGYDLT